MTHPLAHYNGNHKWLVDRTFFVTRHGSHAYGTNLPTSDLDLKGIFVAPPEYYLGFLNKVGTVDKGFAPVDAAAFELRRFFELAAQCNPNVIELLYTDPSDHLWVSPLAEKLLDARAGFLSQQAVHTFSGYAVAQLKRIQGHHRWLRMVANGNEPRMPTRAEFDLPEQPTIPHDQREAAESLVRKQLEAWEVPTDDLDEAGKISFKAEFERVLVEMALASDEELWRAAGRHVGLDDNFMEVVVNERRYHSKVKEYRQYVEWKENRNEARSALEEKFGYDTKHAMHLFRLMRMGEEIVSKGEVRVRRPDAKELLEIRAGALSYEEVVAFAEKSLESLKEIVKTSPLPKQPNRAKLDELCVTLVSEALRDNAVLRGRHPTP